MVLVPKMPALGLLLEYPIFDSYNQKVTAANEREKYDDSHVDFRPPINFEQYRSMIDAFKQKSIYQDMRATEDRYGMYVPFQDSSAIGSIEGRVDSTPGYGMWTVTKATICCT